MSRVAHTIASLRLDIDAATEGRTWLLLPDGFRDSGSDYPLPTSRAELQQLIAIPLRKGKLDSGCIYIRRAIEALRDKRRERQDVLRQAERQGTRLRVAEHRNREQMQRMQAEARAEVDKVRQVAAESIASLTDLFALGRKGLEAQMQAHLNGSEWQGEPINARAFRECFRMVSQAVKGLGLPSDQRIDATQTIMDEVAAALSDTQDAVKPPTPETEH